MLAVNSQTVEAAEVFLDRAPLIMEQSLRTAGAEFLHNTETPPGPHPPGSLLRALLKEEWATFFFFFEAECSFLYCFEILFSWLIL